MKTFPRFLWVLVCCFSILFIAPVMTSIADDDEHRERKAWHGGRVDHEDEHEHDDHERHENEHLAPVDNAAYEQACGTCHFAYQPGLLPAGSWGNIMENLPGHFGEAVLLEPEQQKNVKNYLLENAAENSPAERSRKILRSLHGRTPLRITEIPYIKKKHDDLDADVFRRQSIGSFSNCAACHTTAEQGRYDDDDVRVPK